MFSAAAAKSLQSCLTLCDPIDGSPPGSPVPGILQARTLEWAAISFSNAWKWKAKVNLLSCVRLLATPWTAAYQAPPSMGFSRKEHWSGGPLPSLVCFLCGLKNLPEGVYGVGDKGWIGVQHAHTSACERLEPELIKVKVHACKLVFVKVWFPSQQHQPCLGLCGKQFSDYTLTTETTSLDVGHSNLTSPSNDSDAQ